MAQKPIREVDAKALIRDYIASDTPPVVEFAPIGPDTDISSLPKTYPWLTQGKIVAKVDELFGKRGKRGYICIAESFDEAKKWIEDLRDTEVDIDGKKGVLRHFLIEPFVPHEQEYYIAFSTARSNDVLSFSLKGGVDVEDNHEHIQEIEIPLDCDDIDVILSSSKDDYNIPETILPTINALFTVWKTLDMSFLEINPLVVSERGIHLLDAVCRVDTCASYRQRDQWKSMDIPDGFGTTHTPAEVAIAKLDAKSGSSLKFVLLNPKGHIWTMVAGGGASIIYADDICDQIDANELANYGEWSGNPSTDEMESYAGHILDTIHEHHGSSSAPVSLIIGGGIANFTDVKKTFTGVIKALKTRADTMKSYLHIFVRRAGPSDIAGRALLQKACDDLGIPCKTYGAELPMTDIVGMAISSLEPSR